MDRLTNPLMGIANTSSTTAGIQNLSNNGANNGTTAIDGVEIKTEKMDEDMVSAMKQKNCK